MTTSENGAWAKSYPELLKGVPASHEAFIGAIRGTDRSRTPGEVGLAAVALCEAITAHGHKHVVCVEGIPAALDRLRELLAPGDVLLTLGAGDVHKVGTGFLKGAA